MELCTVYAQWYLSYVKESDIFEVYFVYYTLRC